ncbi:hypothetical protein D3C76_1577950 [compost metagenome]
MQGVARQNRVSFPKFDMAGWLPTAQIVVIHRWQVVMDQRIGMDALHRRRWGIQILQAQAKHLPGGVNQERP